MVLATIQVPLSGGGSPTVIWVAPYTVAAGAPTPVWSAADRDAKFPTPYDGLQIYRLDLHLVETYNAGTASWRGGTGTPTGPVVTWATGTTASVASGTIVIPAVTLPAVGCATRVWIQAEGSAGFNAAAVDVGLSIGGSQAVTQGLTVAPGLVRAQAALYTRVTQSGYMDIPANTSATVSLAGLAQFSGNTAYFNASMTLTRVNTN